MYPIINNSIRFLICSHSFLLGKIGTPLEYTIAGHILQKLKAQQLLQFLSISLK